MSESVSWEEFFSRREATKLALLARRLGRFQGPKLRALADDEILLEGSAALAARVSSKSKLSQSPECIVLTAATGERPDDFDKKLRELRELYPQAELAGFGPADWSPGKDVTLDRYVFRLGTVGENFEVEKDWDKRVALSHARETTAVLLYGPSVSSEALVQAVSTLIGIEGLSAVVPLPLGAGDRIPLKGMTTSGNLDMTMVAALCLLLPSHVRVRASWAVMGWKVAQLGPVYGASELMGWSAAETLAYTGRVRSAARVESAELEAGLKEGGISRCSWSESKVGSFS